MHAKTFSVLACAIGVLSCGLPATPSDLQVSVAVDKAVFTHGDTLRVTIVARNISTSSQPIFNTWCPRTYRLYDGNGEDVGIPFSYGCSLGGGNPPLAPGDSIVRHETWDGTRYAQDGSPVPAARGRYHIVAYIYSTETATSPALSVWKN